MLHVYISTTRYIFLSMSILALQVKHFIVSAGRKFEEKVAQFLKTPLNLFWVFGLTLL